VASHFLTSNLKLSLTKLDVATAQGVPLAGSPIPINVNERPVEPPSNHGVAPGAKVGVSYNRIRNSVGLPRIGNGKGNCNSNGRPVGQQPKLVSKTPGNFVVEFQAPTKPGECNFRPGRRTN